MLCLQMFLPLQEQWWKGKGQMKHELNLVWLWRHNSYCDYRVFRETWETVFSLKGRTLENNACNKLSIKVTRGRGWTSVWFFLLFKSFIWFQLTTWLKSPPPPLFKHLAQLISAVWSLLKCWNFSVSGLLWDGTVPACLKLAWHAPFKMHLTIK